MKQCLILSVQHPSQLLGIAVLTAGKVLHMYVGTGGRETTAPREVLTGQEEGFSL